MSGPKTVAALVEVGERVLRDSSHIFSDHDFRRDAEELLASCLRVARDELDGEFKPTPRQSERYLSLIARRAAGEPLPHLTGHIEFWGLDLRVRPGAFVPRPSSELLVERALRRLQRRREPTVVDVCSGAAPIALAVADEMPSAEVWALDISGEALDQGRGNARRLGIRNVRFRRGDMYEPLPQRLARRVDVITAHVPYVPRAELEDLPSEVKEHEPLHTLTDDADGMSLMQAAVDGSPAWLRPGGWLLLEMSEDFAPRARKLCARAGFADVRVASDEDGLSVVVEARRPR